MTAAASNQVPSIYDIVIDGTGYIYDRVQGDSSGSLAMGAQRGSLGYTPTFLPRTNVQGNFGDDQQAFWFTASQTDWSLGEGQNFFRSSDSDSVRRYQSGSGLDPTTQGKLGLARDFLRLTSFNKMVASSPTQTNGVFGFRTTGASGSLFTTTLAGTTTDQGDPGCGSQNQWGICTDGVYTYLAGSTQIRKWDGASFANFGASITNAGALAFHNNALYSCDGSVLVTYNGSGSPTTVFTWKDATNTALTPLAQRPKVIPFGGKLLIFFPQYEGAPQVYQYDGSAVSLVAELPRGTVGYDMFEILGVVYLSGLVYDIPGGIDSTSPGSYPVVYELVGSSLSLLWRGTTNFGALIPPTKNQHGLPALGAFGGNLAFVAGRTLRFYNIATGAVWTLGTVPADAPPVSSLSYVTLATDPGGVLIGIAGTPQIDSRLYPGPSWSSSGSVSLSNFDFDSSQSKIFGSVRVEWTSASDGTVDMSYSVDGGTFSGSFTGVTSGAENHFPTGASTVTGKSIQILLTVRFGSFAAPVITRVYVKAAPILQQTRRATYHIDCTGKDGKNNVVLNNGQSCPMDGQQLLDSFVTSAKKTTLISITDNISTYNGIIELDTISVIPTRPSEYIVQFSAREV